MRKALALAVLGMFALMCVAVPTQAAPASERGALHAELDIRLTIPPGHWWGNLTGDITGMGIYGGLPGAWQSGHILHFYEIFRICFGKITTPEECYNPVSYIEGYEEGVYYVDYKASGEHHFQARGWVTAASPDHADMIGWKYLENGFTTGFPLPLYGIGPTKVVLAPAN